MFRSLNEDDGGFVNKGLEISDENGEVHGSRSCNEASSTKIEITRSKYDQQKLHDEMLYRKPPSKSGEFFRLVIFSTYFKLKLKGTFHSRQHFTIKDDSHI